MQISIISRIIVGLSASEVFNQIGRGLREATSILPIQCDALAPQRPVELTLPIQFASGVHETRILGRITDVTPDKSFTIRQDMPWSGTLTCTLTPVDEGTELRLVARVSESQLAEVVAYMGMTPPECEQDSSESQIRVGLIMSKSGPGSVFAAASEHLAGLAIEELNEDADRKDSRFKLVVADDRTDPLEAARVAERLIKSGVSVIVSNVTSLSFEAIQRVCGRDGPLLVYTPLNEGGEEGRRVFRLGERPADQLRRSVPLLMAETGARNWYLAGNQYSWPQWTNRVARRYIRASGGSVVEEEYRQLGTRDFSSLIENISRSGADAILSTFVGADEVAFERQCFDSGLRSHVQTLSLAMDEATRERVGDDAANRIWTSFGYFQCLDSAQNRQFLNRYRTRFGEFAPPISSISESVYEAILLYGRAVREAGTPDPLEMSRRFAHVRIETPRGVADVSMRFGQSTLIGRAIPGGFAVTA